MIDCHDHKHFILKPGSFIFTLPEKPFPVYSVKVNACF